MGIPTRPEPDKGRLAARERKLRLVIEILNGRAAEYRRSRQPTPPGLRQSIADFGQQLSEVRRRRADLTTERRRDTTGRFVEPTAGKPKRSADVPR